MRRARRLVRRARPSTGRRRPGPADPDTRQRVIEVATRLFSARGFKHVTVRDICREARANIAAVNYHFGDKVGLYRDVIEVAVSAVEETTVLAKQAGEGLPPADQLRAYIRIHAERIFGGMPHPNGPSVLQQIIQREVDEPILGSSALIHRMLRPRFDYLFGIVGQLLALPPDDQRVKLSALTIHGMILMFRPTPFAARIGAELGIAFSHQEIADHIVAFALGATQALAGAAPST